MEVNNAIYENLGHTWWDSDAGFEVSSLRYCLNPLRYSFFKRNLHQIPLTGNTMLDIGCGGGFLAEEFAKDGYEVTGIDPAVNSIQAARQHAAQCNLPIHYHVGRGESLPFPDFKFDVVACCDVLEHVDDVNRVIAEAARTLKRGGVFLFDTVNRTLKSRIVLIKVWQDWGLAGFSEPNVHVWERFIKPVELGAILRLNGLEPGEMKGISPKKHPAALIMALLRIRAGRMRGRAIAEAFAMRETNDLDVSYMGLATRL